MQQPEADKEQRTDEKAPTQSLIYSTFYYVTRI